MWDGLIEILMSWLSQAFCWLVTQLVSLAVGLMQLVSGLMPAVAVPDWLNSPWTADIASAIAWLLPMQAVSWMLLGYFIIEVAHFVALVFYRAFMDLL